VPIEVGKTGIEDLKVTVPPWVTLQGRLRAPDPDQRWQSTSRVLLKGIRTGSDICDNVKPDGTFECSDIPPGEVQVQVPAMFVKDQRTQRLTAKEIRFGGQDGVRKPITVSEAGNPMLDILFSDDPSGISGKVLDEGKEKSNYLITLRFAVAAGTQSGLILGTRGTMLVSGSDFQFPGLTPSDYDLTARRIPRTGSSSISSAVCDQTVRVTVRDGVVTTVNLRPCEP
jgi:hypothetical protein